MQDTLDTIGGLRTRLYMLAYRLFYSCTVKEYNTVYTTVV